MIGEQAQQNICHRLPTISEMRLEESKLMRERLLLRQQGNLSRTPPPEINPPARGKYGARL